MNAVRHNRRDETIRIRALLERVADPEIPVLSIVDLGIVRDVCDVDDRLEVVITPTYSGCPAMNAIETDIRRVLDAAGFVDATIRTVLSPAWTTDWLTAEGRRKLEAYGIAPPAETSASKRALWDESPVVACPRCRSRDTEQLSEFGSTACKAQWRCRDCLEPFDYFKCL